jgi:O-acetyl-ADP-ribose deacetylase
MSTANETGMKTIRSFTNLFKLGLKAAAMSSPADYAAALVGDSGKLLRTYQLANNRCLTVVQGSVVDFRSTNGAIVNAANEGCLSGGGVDGAITNVGGPNLAKDRRKLPVLSWDIRCYTGDAKRTGPGNYGSLRVPYVIHAVGPDYNSYDEDNDVETPHSLLQNAYAAALDCTLDTSIQKVAFALLSAGIFRGEQRLSTVLCLGVEAIRDWSSDQSKLGNSKLEDIVLYAFTDKEAMTLLQVCDFLLPSKSDEEDVKQTPIEQNERGEGTVMLTTAEIKEDATRVDGPPAVEAQYDGTKGSRKMTAINGYVIAGGDDGSGTKIIKEEKSKKLKTGDTEPNDGDSSNAEQTDKPAVQMNCDQENPDESEP